MTGAAELLTPVELAQLIGATETTLRNWRSPGKGPPFFAMQLAEQKKSEIRVRLEAPVHQEPKSWRRRSD